MSKKKRTIGEDDIMKEKEKMVQFFKYRGPSPGPHTCDPLSPGYISKPTVRLFTTNMPLNID